MIVGSFAGLAACSTAIGLRMSEIADQGATNTIMRIGMACGATAIASGIIGMWTEKE